MAQDKDNNKSKGCLIFILVFIIGGVIFTNAIDLDNNKNDGPTKLTAYSMVQGWVEDRLKAPSTAEFPGGKYEEHTMQTTENVFRVSSYVDAENSFGAKIRTRFKAKVKYLGNGEWELMSLDIEN